MRLIWEFLLKGLGILFGVMVGLSLIGAAIMNIFVKKKEDDDESEDV